MNPGKGLFTNKDRVCPWWLIWTFDNPLRRLIHDPEAIIGPMLREGQTAADIGCGRGYFSVAMARMVGSKGHVIAADLQEKMLDMLRKRAARAGVVERIRTVLSKTDDIMVPEPVDFVLAFWMVHEVKDIPRFFSQVSAILKQGGKVLYVEPRMHVTSRRFREILEYARQAGFQASDGPAVRMSRSSVLTGGAK